MRKLLCLLMFALPMLAQRATVTSAIYVTGPPSGSLCTTNLENLESIDVSAGNTYYCHSGAWVAGSGGSTSGTVTSGTAFSPTYYGATGTIVSGTTPFTGIEYWPGGGAPRAAVAGNFASSETVASSATPTFSVNFGTSYNVLTANVTSFTLASGTDGQHKTLCFKQGSGSYTVAGPSNVHGLMTVGTTNGDYNCQSFVYNAANTIWLADSPGVVNE